VPAALDLRGDLYGELAAGLDCVGAARFDGPRNGALRSRRNREKHKRGNEKGQVF
jgi:hypothetical protein